MSFSYLQVLSSWHVGVSGFLLDSVSGFVGVYFFGLLD